MCGVCGGDGRSCALCLNTFQKALRQFGEFVHKFVYIHKLKPGSQLKYVDILETQVVVCFVHKIIHIMSRPVIIATCPVSHLL